MCALSKREMLKNISFFLLKKGLQIFLIFILSLNKKWYNFLRGKNYEKE